MRTISSGSSGQSRALPAVMMAAITIALGSGVSAYMLGLTSGLDEEAPTIGQTSGALEAVDGGYQVRILHVAGDVVTVSGLEVIVDATDACGKRARLVGLPTDRIGPDDVEGASIFSPAGLEAGALGTGGDGEWSAGERLQFGIDGDRCEIEPGESVTVRVVHVPSDAVLVRADIPAG